ncbi:hypothetical protein H9P43_009741 [Blastocladiella emersonii ATCC 22665]|nr:hypothetical protein H9P43_009741 [Blastocladiella emersonii ATCC 22665]
MNSPTYTQNDPSASTGPDVRPHKRQRTSGGRDGGAWGDGHNGGLDDVDTYDDFQAYDMVPLGGDAGDDDANYAGADDDRAMAAALLGSATAQAAPAGDNSDSDHGDSDPGFHIEGAIVDGLPRHARNVLCGREVPDAGLLPKDRAIMSNAMYKFLDLPATAKPPTRNAGIRPLKESANKVAEAIHYENTVRSGLNLRATLSAMVSVDKLAKVLKDALGKDHEALELLEDGAEYVGMAFALTADDVRHATVQRRTAYVRKNGVQGEVALEIARTVPTRRTEDDTLTLFNMGVYTKELNDQLGHAAAAAGYVQLGNQTASFAPASGLGGGAKGGANKGAPYKNSRASRGGRGGARGWLGSGRGGYTGHAGQSASGRGKGNGGEASAKSSEPRN